MCWGGCCSRGTQQRQGTLRGSDGARDMPSCGDAVPMMNVRDALENVKGARVCIDDHPLSGGYCHQCTASIARRELVDDLAPIIEKFGRAAYWEGVNDARYADLHPKDKYGTLDGQEGIDAGVTAMISNS